MNLANSWKDYKILDMSDGMKLESWNGIILSRPDPQIIWDEKTNPKLWNKANAIYHRSKTGGGYWEYKNNISDRWTVNWDYMIDKIKKSNRHINVLNLFAYTGGATVACAYAGADVVHVDSSKGMTAWAKENIISSNLQDKNVRFIVDDVIKFVQREIRRGHKYDAIIMDPPSFGRGANKEVWNIEESLFKLIKLCEDVLSDDPLFFLINSYTTGMSPKVLENILSLTINKKHEGKISSGEVGLPMENSDLVLPCGIYGRWEKDE